MCGISLELYTDNTTGFKLVILWVIILKNITLKHFKIYIVVSKGTLSVGRCAALVRGSNEINRNTKQISIIPFKNIYTLSGACNSK